MSTLAETLRRKVDVPKDMFLQAFEFGDALHGYALFGSRQPISRPSEDPATWAYGSLIFATRDGGRTWTAFTNPAPPVSVTVDAVGANTVIVSSNSATGSWVSVDGGLTFRREPNMDPYDVAMQMLQPHPIGVLGGKVFLDYSQPTRRALANQPELPGFGAWTAVRGAGTRLVAASAERAGDTAYTAISDDGGRTWRRRDVPRQELTGSLEGLQLVASPDRSEVWLLGYVAMPAGGFGSARHALKYIGLPVIWRLDGDRWVSKGTVGRPAPRPPGPNEDYSLAPVGGGLIAVAGPIGLALVDDGWTMTAFPPGVHRVDTLTDGTVVASEGLSYATVYLGQRSGGAVRWTQITLDH